LHIASIDEVAESSTSQFDTVVSVCQDTVEANVSAGLAADTDSDSAESEEVGCPYHHIALADGRESQRNWGGSIEYKDFVRAAETVIASVQDGTTLVHCHKGRNRSAAVCAAVIATHYEHTFDAAVDLVERMNPQTSFSPLMYVFARRFAREY
jgi:protein-tyrosine phosphatase